MILLKEIFEQPERLANLLTTGRSAVEEIARAIQSRDIQYVYLAARGTSDNAGRYANYLWGSCNGYPLALATPSLFTYYLKPPRIQNALVVGISQSGQSPDIASVVSEGKRQGNLTLAITNDPASPLAQQSSCVLDIQAGAEKAVAATKSYTCELMAIAMLSAALRNESKAWDELEQVSGWIDAVLIQSETIKQAVQRYRYMQQCVVLGRGFNYATAFEWALKLKELTYVAAEPYSSADFQHGPVAMVAQGFPVLAVNPLGSVHKSMTDLLVHLKNNLQAEIVLITNSTDTLSLAQVPIQIPPETPEWLTPIVCIAAAQLFSCHLTEIKGFDTDQPRSIQKVTETH